MALTPAVGRSAAASDDGSGSHKDLLRFITCGSVDDGKSTMIGRLLYESELLFDDQLAALEAGVRTQDEHFDFALLLDGLMAEREQGITIDVAYRYFDTERRRFIVADTPGHEQYTRNTVTGASTADCAVVLVDGRKGVLTQTRRHTHLLALLGVRHVALAVNKLDLLDWQEERFRCIEDEYVSYARQLGLSDVTCIPMSALCGDNVVASSPNMPWYRGPALLEYLESVEIDEERLQASPMRMPVQWVNRAGLDFRGFAGLIVGGRICPGDPIVVEPSGQTSSVARIVTYEGDLDCAVAGQSVTLTLTSDVDVSRGDVIADAHARPEAGDQFEATIIWMGSEPLLRGRSYVMRIGTRTVSAVTAPLKYKLNVDSLEHVAAEELRLNEIGVCEIELDQAISFDPYSQNRDMGGFVLIDRITNDTIGAGVLNFELRRSQNVHEQAISVDKRARAELMGQRPCVLWLTGLSGAGKSTIADGVERKLHAMGRHTCLLDGDNVRRGLNRDLGFSDADRVENIRRIAEVSKLMVETGLIVIASFICPFTSERRMARALFEPGEFIEVFVDAPLAVAEIRDPKGLYARARRGEIENFTGIGSPYEPPETPELHIKTAEVSVDEAIELVLEALRR